MSSLMSVITKGKVKRPFCILIYGVDGCGKSTFASNAPNPIFIGPEQGTDHLDVARFPTSKSWSDVDQALDELIKEEHQFKTLVIDSLDWLEPLIHQKICAEHKVKSIELASGGYGKGYIEALNVFLSFKNKLNILRETKKMNIILIAHSQIVTFNDPQNQNQYERFEMKLHKKSSAMFREYVDAVLFFTHKIYSTKDGNETRVYGSGERIIRTQYSPGWDAKNRYGLPEEIPLNWNEFVSAARPENAGDIKNRLEKMIESIPESKIEAVKKAITAAGDDVEKLTAVENRLKLVGEKK